MIRKTGRQAIRPYLEDASGMAGGHADEVVLPETAAEVAELLRESGAAGVPVTVSGGGTGLAGGRVPMGGRVLATDRLGGVREVRREGDAGIATLGPAATLADVEAAAAEQGLFLPPDPTERTAWAGGAVATNASGSRTFHYGPLRRYVRRLRLVLADGTVIDAPRGRHVAGRSGEIELPGRDGPRRVPVPRRAAPPVKSATGYASGAGLDLVDLVVGSEGTLAAVTEIDLLLLPRPEKVLSGIVFFPSEGDCLSAVEEIRRRTYAARGHGGPAPSTARRPPAPASSRGILARALELFGEDALGLAREGGVELPPAARAGLLFEQEHRERDEEEVAGAWLKLLEGHRALLDDSWTALGDAERRRIREFRHALPAAVNEWLRRHGRSKHGTDIAVPDATFPELWAAYRGGLRESGLRSATFGHVGDNHLHVNLLPRDDEEERAARELLLRWARLAARLGGVPSAEHGIGKLKAGLFLAVADPGRIADMRRVKKALDPAWILGRGNLLPED